MRRLQTALRTRWLVGVRAAVTLGLPLLIGVAVGHASYGAIASMGALAGFSVGTSPWAYRAKVIPTVGAATMVIVPVSGLLSDIAWLAIIWVGFVAVVASYVCLAAHMGPPREYLIVLTALAGTGIPVDLDGALREVWLVAAGAATAWLVALVFTLIDPAPSPARQAVDQAQAAVAGILRAAGTDDAARARQSAVSAVHAARVALRQTGSREAADLAGRQAAIEVLLATTLSISIESTEPLDPAAANAVLASPDEPADTAGLPAPLTTALATARTLNRGYDAEPGPPATGLGRLLDGLGSRDVVLPTALRIGVSVAIGTAVGRLLGLEHSYWVGLTCAAALQANNVTMLFRRSMHRFVGTVTGVGLAGAVFAFSPTAAAVAVAATIAQLIAEIVIVANYAVAVTFITVIALSVYDLAAPHAQIGSTIDARLLDTVIGAALVVILRMLLWPKTNSTRLPAARADTVRSIADVLRIRWTSGDDNTHRAPGLVAAQHHLQERLLSLRTLADDATADRLLTAGSRHDRAVTLAVEDLADLALSIPTERPLPAADQVHAQLAQLNSIAAALEGQSEPPGPPNYRLDGFPRTLAATRVLSSALDVS